MKIPSGKKQHNAAQIIRGKKKRVHAKNKTFKIQMLEHTIDVSEVKI